MWNILILNLDLALRQVKVFSRLWTNDLTCEHSWTQSQRTNHSWARITWRENFKPERKKKHQLTMSVEKLKKKINRKNRDSVLGSQKNTAAERTKRKEETGFSYVSVWESDTYRVWAVLLCHWGVIRLGQLAAPGRGCVSGAQLLPSKHWAPPLPAWDRLTQFNHTHIIHLHTHTRTQ